MARTLSAVVTERSEAKILKPITLVTLTVYTDRRSKTGATVYRLSDRAVRYDYGSTGDDLTFEPLLESIDVEANLMSHLPESSDVEGGLYRSVELSILNKPYQGGANFWATLRTLNMNFATVEIAELLAGEADSFTDFSTGNTTYVGKEHTVLFRGELRQVNSANDNSIRITFESERPQIDWLIADGANTAPRDLGKRWPKPYGKMKKVPAVAYSVGKSTTLATELLAGGTTATVTDDTTDWPNTGSIMIGLEEIDYSGTSGFTLTGLTRNVNGAGDLPHTSGAVVVSLLANQIYGVSDRESSAIGDVYALSPFNKELVRITDVLTKDANDTTTISGRTVSTIQISKAEIKAIFTTLATQAKVTQQPARSTDTILSTSGPAVTIGLQFITSSTGSCPFDLLRNVPTSSPSSWCQLATSASGTVTWDNPGTILSQTFEVTMGTSFSGANGSTVFRANNSSGMVILIVLGSQLIVGLKTHTSGAIVSGANFNKVHYSHSHSQGVPRLAYFRRTDLTYIPSPTEVTVQPQVSETDATQVKISAGTVGFGLELYVDVDGAKSSKAVSRVDGSWTTDDTTDIASYQVPAGTNRLLVYVLAPEDNSRTMVVSGVTYGGVAMTRGVAAKRIDAGLQALNLCELWYLKEADIPAGGPFAFVTTYTLSPSSELYACVTYDNVDQVTPIGEFGLANDEDVTALSVALPQYTNGMSIAACANGGPKTHVWSAPFTEQVDQTDSGATQVAMSIAQDTGSSNSASITATVTASGSSNRFAMFHCYLNPHGSGGYSVADDTLIENLPDIMRHLIGLEAGLGSSAIDHINFVTAVLQLGLNKHAFDARSLGTSWEEIVSRLVFEGRSNLTREETLSACQFRLFAAFNGFKSLDADAANWTTGTNATLSDDISVKKSGDGSLKAVADSAALENIERLWFAPDTSTLVITGMKLKFHLRVDNAVHINAATAIEIELHCPDSSNKLEWQLGSDDGMADAVFVEYTLDLDTEESSTGSPNRSSFKSIFIEFNRVAAAVGATIYLDNLRLVSGDGHVYWFTPSVLTITEYVGGTEEEPKPIDLIITRMRSVYNQNLALGGGIDSFEKLFNIDVDNNDADGSIFVVDLTNAEKRWGRRDQEQVIQFVTIRDDATMFDVMTYYAQEGLRESSGFFITGVPWKEAYKLQDADVAKFTPTWGSVELHGRLTGVERRPADGLFDLSLVQVPTRN